MSDAVRSTLRRIVRAATRLGGGERPRPDRAPTEGTTPPSPAAYPTYAGDATTLPEMTYQPQPDGQPDPGEIVWAWVPYEEDHTRGKDRPVLVVGREGDLLVAVPLTSKDHDRDAGQERGAGREWVDIGTGGWDGRGRPSEVRVNRLLRLDAAGVRREGAVLGRDRYDDVVAAIRAHHQAT